MAHLVTGLPEVLPDTGHGVRTGTWGELYTLGSSVPSSAASRGQQNLWVSVPTQAYLLEEFEMLEMVPEMPTLPLSSP